MSKSNQVLKTIGKVSSLMIIQKLCNFISMIILARLLTPYEFGVMAAAMIIIEFSNMLPSVGIPLTLIQRKELSKTDLRAGFTLLLIVSITIYMALFLSRNVMADIMDISDLQIVIPILALSILFEILSNTSSALLQRNEQVYKLSVIQTIYICLSTFIITIPLAYYGFGYWSLIISHLLQSFCISITLFLYARFPLSLKWNSKIIKNIFTQGFGFFFVRLLSLIPSKADSLIIGAFYGAKDLGYYGRAHRLMDYPNAIYSSSAGRVIFPAMARIQDNPEKLLNVLKRGLQLTAIFSMPITTIICICHYEIVIILLGEQWEKTAEILGILSLFIFFGINWNVFSVYFRAQGLIKMLTINSAINAVSSIVIIYIASQYSLLAVAWGSGLAIVFSWLMILGQISYYTKRNILEFLQCFIGSAVTSFILAFILLTFRVYFIDSMSILSLLLIEILLIILYGCTLWILKPVFLLGQDIVNTINKININISRLMHK